MIFAKLFTPLLQGLELNAMALLNILEFPDPRLRTVAEPVKDVNGKIAMLADNMLETMYAAPGIGLAASQVNMHLRLLVGGGCF